MKILIWVQSSYGIGHLVMAARFASRIDDDVTIAYGGARVDYPGNIRYISPLVDNPSDRRLIISPDGIETSLAFQRRKEELKTTYDEIRPDILITEHFPFGRTRFRDEVLWLIGYAKGSRVFSLVRDIVRTDLQHIESDINLFDEILVLGDRSIIEFPYKGARYLGYLVPKMKKPAGDAIYVGVGGGITGEKLINKVFALDLPKVEVIGGPNLRISEIPEKVNFHRFALSEEIIPNARFGISQAGYNSMMDAAASGLPWHFFPCNSEQVIRARRFGELFGYTVGDDIRVNYRQVREFPKYDVNREFQRLIDPIAASGFFDDYDKYREILKHGLSAEPSQVSNTQDPQISVIIPVRNNTDLLYATLASLEKQSVAFEAVIVDDGSGKKIDNLPDSCTYIRCDRENYASDIPLNRAGPIRNKGVQYARSWLLLFLDADMVLEPGSLKRHIELQKNQCAVLGSRSDDYREPYSHIDSIPNQWKLVHSHHFSIPKNIFLEVGGFSDAFIYWGVEDEELGYRLAKAGVEILYEKSIIARHQEHAPEQRYAVQKKLADIFQYRKFYEMHKDKSILSSYNFDTRLTLRLYDKCNNNCAGCAKTGKMGKFTPLEEIEQELRDAKKSRIHLRLGGGEPAMHPGFDRILELVKGMQVELMTNARIFSRNDFVDKTIKSISNFLVFIYGSSYTNVQESGEQAERGIKNLLDAGANLNFRYVVNDNNIGELSQIIRKHGPGQLQYIPTGTVEKFRANIKYLRTIPGLVLLNPFFACYMEDHAAQVRQCLKCEVLELCRSTPGYPDG